MSPRDSDARELATLASTGAAEAMREVSVVRGQARVIAWLLGAIGATLVGGFGWLLLEVRSQGEQAAKRAEVVAEQAVLRADRRIDDRMAQVAQDAAREALRLRDEQVDRLAARQP